METVYIYMHIPGIWEINVNHGYNDECFCFLMIHWSIVWSRLDVVLNEVRSLNKIIWDSSGYTLQCQHGKLQYKISTEVCSWEHLL